MSDFEESLLALDAKLDEAQKLGKAVVAAIGRIRAVVRVGRVGDIARGLISSCAGSKKPAPQPVRWLAVGASIHRPIWQTAAFPMT